MYLYQVNTQNSNIRYMKLIFIYVAIRNYAKQIQINKTVTFV